VSLRMIAPATPADLAAMAAIEARAQKHPWTETQLAAELSLPQARVTVARVDGAVAGYLVAWLVAGDLQILNVCVSVDMRRRGIGRALLTDALALCQSATLDVRRGNVEALGLYSGHGFREDGVRRGYYSDGEDAILMSWSAP